VHILTKILVVAATLLAVLLGALTSAYTLNADRVVTDWKASRDGQVAANSQLNAQLADSAAQSSAKQAEVDSLRGEIGRLTGRIADLQSENASLRSEARQATERTEALTTQIGAFAKTNEAQVELIKGLRAEAQKLRANEVAYREREIDLVDRLNDLTSQNDVLNSQVRALQVQLAELQEMARNGGFAAGASNGAGDVGVIGGPLVEGEIVAVQRDGDRLLAEVNLGEGDRMRENARLYIVGRNNNFLGHFIVEDVQLQSSIGRIDTLQLNSTVRAGDRVMTRFN